MFEQSGHQSKEYDHSYASNKAKTEVLGNREDKKDYGNNDCHGNDFSIRNRDAQIQQINREYNAKIHEVKHQRALISYEKNQQIRNLQQEKSEKIQQINDRYNHSSGRYYDPRTSVDDCRNH